MPNKALELDDGFFLLKIAQNKRITLPDKMIEHLEVQDGDILILKLTPDMKAELKKFNTELITSLT